MPQAKELIDLLRNKGAGLFTGVPDSLLSQLSATILADSSIEHIIAVNEGNAIGLAIGDYLATARPAVVYMQNSGLGNTVNPITSLADPAVYGIPMMLVIGWRGEPGHKDEPQHVKQGEITLGQLNILGIPFAIVDSSTDLNKIIPSLWQQMLERKGPVALVVRKDALTGDAKLQVNNPYSLKREEAIDTLIKTLPVESFYIATTGKTGRELFELRKKYQQDQRDFLTVGGMGHASAIALAIALKQKTRLSVCLDGDGASLMHLGGMVSIAEQKPKRFLHVLLNNYAHESVGGQPTVAHQVDYQLLAQALGYDGYYLASSLDEVETTARQLGDKDGCFLFEIRLAQGSRKELGRPTRTPSQNKESVMAFLSK